MERLKVTGGKVPHVVPACLPWGENESNGSVAHHVLDGPAASRYWPCLSAGALRAPPTYNAHGLCACCLAGMALHSLHSETSTPTNRGRAGPGNNVCHFGRRFGRRPFLAHPMRAFWQTCRTYFKIRKPYYSFNAADVFHKHTMTGPKNGTSSNTSAT